MHNIENNSFTNTSYIFIPFIFDEKQVEFLTLMRALNESPTWTQVHDEIKYMLKYVADKLNNQDEKNCSCFHYRLNEAAYKTFGLEEVGNWYRTVELPLNENTKKIYKFQILSVQLYCFSTSVCIMAFQVHFETNEPLEISAAQYFLKKVSRPILCTESDSTVPFSMLSVAENIMSAFHTVGHFSFFYYAPSGEERANMLTYLEIPPQADYKYLLYYLRRCYSPGYLYTEDAKAESEEIYMSSKDIIWGLSSEAAVCLTVPSDGRSAFIHNVFYPNFNAQYLFMYILLLHQKYVLYMFLMKIGIGTYNDLETLESYRQQLYEFETDFVFSCLTEVPQYQNVYERMTKAFALRQMYEDVHEPLISLSEVRRVHSENKQKKRDEKLNNSLFLLSILSFFSALIDSFDFVDSFFGQFLGEIAVKGIQGVCIVGIICIAVYIIYTLRKKE